MRPSIAPAVGRLGTEGAFAVLARARALEATGRDVIHLEIGEPDFETPPHVAEAGIAAIRAGETHYCQTAGLPGPARGGRRSLADVARRRDRSRERRRRDRCQAVPLLHGARDLRPGRRGDLPRSGLPDLRVGGALLGRDAGAAAAARGARVQLRPRRARGAARRAHAPRHPQRAAEPDRRRHRAGRSASAPRPRSSRRPPGCSPTRCTRGSPTTSRRRRSRRCPGLLERTVLLDGFSKTFAMTGWRLGYAAVPAELVDPLTRLIVNSTSCVPPFAQLAGVAALEGPQDAVVEMVAEFRRRRDFLVPALNAIPGRALHRARRRLLRVPERVRAADRCRRARRPAARRGGRRRARRARSFGGHGDGHLRISYASSLENLEQAVERIRAFVAAL